MSKLTQRQDQFGINFNYATTSLLVQQDRHIVIAPGEPRFITTDDGTFITTDDGTFITTND